jgi:hypothetical protein
MCTNFFFTIPASKHPCLCPDSKKPFLIYALKVDISPLIRALAAAAFSFFAQVASPIFAQTAAFSSFL